MLKIPYFLVDIPEAILRWKVANKLEPNDLKQILNSVCKEVARNKELDFKQTAHALFPDVFLEP